MRRVVAGHRCLVTAAVADELRNAASHPEVAGADLTWLEEVRVDSLGVLGVFAATLAWAEVNGAAAVLDEAAGRRAAQTRGVEVHGTLWLVAEGIRAGEVLEEAAAALVDALKAAGAWLPCDGATFMTWAKEQGLL